MEEKSTRSHKAYTYLPQEEVISLINDYKNNGNIEARDRLFNVYKSMADRMVNNVFDNNKGVCKNILKEDLTQEVYLAIFEFIETYKGNIKTPFSIRLYQSIFDVIKKFLKNVMNVTNIGYLQQFDTLNSSEVVLQEKVEDYCEYNNLKGILSDLLETLTPREEKVLKMRFGLYNGRPMGLSEVGCYFDITRERVKKIEAKGLRKLQYPSCKKRLEGFL